MVLFQDHPAGWSYFRCLKIRPLLIYNLKNMLAFSTMSCEMPLKICYRIMFVSVSVAVSMSVFVLYLCSSHPVSVSEMLFLFVSVSF